MKMGLSPEGEELINHHDDTGYVENLVNSSELPLRAGLSYSEHMIEKLR